MSVASDLPRSERCPIEHSVKFAQFWTRLMGEGGQSVTRTHIESAQAAIGEKNSSESTQADKTLRLSGTSAELLTLRPTGSVNAERLTGVIVECYKSQPRNSFRKEGAPSGTASGRVWASDSRIVGMVEHCPTSKDRILVLTPRFPYPPLGGDRLRIYQICRQLSTRFELSLLSMCESEEEMEAPIPDDGIFVRVERVFHGKWERISGSLRAIPSETPIQVGYYRNADFEKRLNQMAPTHDCLLAHLIRTAAYVTSFKLPKVLEMTDAISMSYLRAARHVKLIKAPLYRMEGRRLLNFEREVASKCDLNVLVSAVDREFLFPSSDSSNVLICSNGVDASVLPFRFTPDGKTIIFIGVNSTRPNMDAILYFQEEVFPLVQRRLPEARFKVIGKIQPEFRRKLEERGVIVTGTVPSVAEAVAGASVGVCPLRIGAGIQNKILEYMAFGVPTVTSPVGLEGLSAVPGVHLMTAIHPSEWADKTVKLLVDRSISGPMAVAARRFVEEHHSWSAHISALADSIHDLIRNSVRGRV